jgi:hypothetical protein
MMDESLPKPDGILPGEAPATPGVPPAAWRRRLPIVLGCLTLIGLACVIAGWNEFDPGSMSGPLTIGGGILLYAAGILWAHTRGWRILKSLFLGALAAPCGAAAGLFLGLALDPGGPQNLGLAIILVFCGFWLGAILFGILGVWWGLRFHGVFRPGPKAVPIDHVPASTT